MTGDEIRQLADQLERIALAVESLAAQHGAPLPVAEPRPCPSEMGGSPCDLRKGHPGVHRCDDEDLTWSTRQEDKNSPAGGVVNTINGPTTGPVIQTDHLEGGVHW